MIAPKGAKGTEEALSRQRGVQGPALEPLMGTWGNALEDLPMAKALEAFGTLQNCESRGKLLSSSKEDKAIRVMQIRSFSCISWVEKQLSKWGSGQNNKKPWDSHNCLNIRMKLSSRPLNEIG